MGEDKNKEFAIELNKRVITEYPGIIQNPKNFLIHIGGVYDIAREIVQKIASNYSNLPLDTGEIAFAAGLHDIGRPLSSGKVGQLAHEMRGARLIEDRGLELGITTSLRDSYRVAQMIRPHASMYEQWKVVQEIIPDVAKSLLDEFGEVNPYVLMVRTWQEAIVTYSDLCDKNGEKVDPIWKLQDAMKRYADDPKIADPVVVEGHRRAMPRLTDLCKTIDGACKKELTDREVKTLFGFL